MKTSLVIGSPVPFFPGCAVVNSAILVITEISVAAGRRAMNCNTCGEGAAFCIDGIIPEVNVRQAAACKGMIPNAFCCGRHIYHLSVAAGEGICHNGNHLFAVNISGNVIYAIGGLLGNARNDNVAAAVGILSVIIVPFPGGTIGICHSG